MHSQTQANHICSHRYSFSLDNFFRQLIQPPKKIVGPYIKPGDSVVDIGCGPGFFTLAMAKMTGESGKVIAVDLQPEMLARIEKKLQGSPLKNFISLHRCGTNSLQLEKSVQADFILAYYMVHETPDQLQFFKEAKQHLRPEGKLLVVEPPFHVNRKAFEKSMRLAEQSGLSVIERPKGKGGMSMVLGHQ